MKNNSIYKFYISPIIMMLTLLFIIGVIIFEIVFLSNNIYKFDFMYNKYKIEFISKNLYNESDTSYYIVLSYYDKDNIIKNKYITLSKNNKYDMFIFNKLNNGFYYVKKTFFDTNDTNNVCLHIVILMILILTIVTIRFIAYDDMYQILFKCESKSDLNFKFDTCYNYEDSLTRCANCYCYKFGICKKTPLNPNNFSEKYSCYKNIKLFLDSYKNVYGYWLYKFLGISDQTFIEYFKNSNNDIYNSYKSIFTNKIKNLNYNTLKKIQLKS